MDRAILHEGCFLKSISLDMDLMMETFAGIELSGMETEPAIGSYLSSCFPVLMSCNHCSPDCFVGYVVIVSDFSQWFLILNNAA